MRTERDSTHSADPRVVARPWLAMNPRHRSRGDGSRPTHAIGCAEQSALLCSLLGALMEQREHLIAGDVPALHRANTRLSELVEAQTALGDGSWRPGPGVDAAELAELLSLAARVTAENAINHLLAIRGLQFADLSSQAVGAEGAGDPLPPSDAEAGAEVSREPAEGLPYGLRLLDTRQ